MAAKARRVNRRQHGEGSVYQRGDGRWAAALDLGWGNGRRRRRYFYGATPEEAIGKRTGFERDLGEGFTRPKGRGDTVADWMWHWLDDIADLKDGSRGGYATNIGQYIVPAIGHMRLPALAEDDGIEAIQAMYAGLRRQGLAESTVLKTHAILRVALETAKMRRKIKINPCDYVTKPRPRKSSPQPPRASEASRVLGAAVQLPNGARWDVGLNLGLRQGEALGLLRPCLDLDAGTMRVDWELVRLTWEHDCDDPHACGAARHRYPCPSPCPKHKHTPGCGGPGCGRKRHECPQWCRPGCTRHAHDPGCPPSCGKRDHVHRYGCEPGCTAHASSCPQRHGGGLVLDTPKSEDSQAVIPIPGYIAARLEQHLARQDAARAAMGPDWTGWGHGCARRPRPREIVCPSCRKPADPAALVFADPYGRPVDPRRDWGEWTNLLEQLRIPHYRVHDGRHFAATLLLEQGVDITIVQAILRHADIRTTKIYTHVSVELGRQALERSAAALWGKDASREAALRTEAAGLDDEIAKLLGDGR